MVELTVVMMAIAALSLAAFKLYGGYQYKAKIDIAVTEMFNIKQEMARNMSQGGSVLWSQYFTYKGWSNPQTLPTVPQVGKTVTASYISCGTGLDCLKLTMTALPDDGMAAACAAKAGGSATCSATNSDFSCTFNE